MEGALLLLNHFFSFFLLIMWSLHLGHDVDSDIHKFPFGNDHDGVDSSIHTYHCSMMLTVANSCIVQDHQNMVEGNQFWKMVAYG